MNIAHAHVHAPADAPAHGSALAPAFTLPHPAPVSVHAQAPAHAPDFEQAPDFGPVVDLARASLSALALAPADSYTRIVLCLSVVDLGP